MIPPRTVAARAILVGLDFLVLVIRCDLLALGSLQDGGRSRTVLGKRCSGHLGVRAGAGLEVLAGEGLERGAGEGLEGGAGACLEGGAGTIVLEPVDLLRGLEAGACSASTSS